KIYIVGIGPGDRADMTEAAAKVLREADVIVGYTVYLGLLGEEFTRGSKELLSTPMRGEKERAELCFKKAAEGKKVALICSGDAGIYGLASLMFEMREEYRRNAGDPVAAAFAAVEPEVIPGITAANSGAAVLGAPLNHDFCTISLSDLLTPWEYIEKRLLAAAEGDFVIVLYNPASRKRADYLKRAVEILMRVLPGDRACGYVKNIGREGTECWTGTLFELGDESVDMFTTVYIGNAESFIADGKLITPRGYNFI
ncbi:MAG: precorrin-3B C(17)-methyltransferase, partial [Eubacteriales bacterium]|nr:precorrin-3B C(17)-methyltransferase [Eubacteriales bacterium]